MNIGIVFATLSGNTMTVTSTLEQYLLDQGHTVTVHDSLETVADELKHYDLVFIGASTYGDGDLNPISEMFFSAAESVHHSCDHTRFAIFSLGDSSYPHFAASGPIMLEKLQQMGATVIHPILSLDGLPTDEMMNEVKKWSEGILVAALASA